MARGTHCTCDRSGHSRVRRLQRPRLEDPNSLSFLTPSTPSRLLPHPEQASSQRRVPHGWRLHSAPSGRGYARPKSQWTKCPCIRLGPRRRLRPTYRGLSPWSLCRSSPNLWTSRLSWPRSKLALCIRRLTAQGLILKRASWWRLLTQMRLEGLPAERTSHKVNISSNIISFLLVRRGFFRGCVSYPGFALCDNAYFSNFSHPFIFLFQRRRTLISRRPVGSAPRPGAPTHRWQGSSR